MAYELIVAHKIFFGRGRQGEVKLKLFSGNVVTLTNLNPDDLQPIISLLNGRDRNVLYDDQTDTFQSVEQNT